MNIGEKIKALRTSKFMTQSQLAGTEITRNMLSRIENGAAQPSLDTLKYIASRLNVSAGYLISEGGDERMYVKRSKTDEIKTAYLAGDFRICREMCLELSDLADDEIQLILAEATLGLAEETFADGDVRGTCEYLDLAIDACASTVYNTDRIYATAAMYFRYLQRISATVSSNSIDENETFVYASFHDPFCRYMANFIATRENSTDEVLPPIGKDTVFASHIEAIRNMKEGDHRGAYEKLHGILVGDAPVPKPMMYFVFCDLEICCREIGDFKGAYEYSIDKLELIQNMLY